MEGANFCVNCGMPLPKTEAKPIGWLGRKLSIREHVYNTDYKAHVLQYTKKQGAHSLLSWFVFFVYFFVAAVVVLIVLDILGIQSFDGYYEQTPVFDGTLAVLMLAGCFVILLINKAKLASVGFGASSIMQAIWFGIIMGAVAIMGGIMFGFMADAEVIFLPITVIIITIISALWEDIFFVGFLQTRLHGLFRHERLAILIGSLCFALFHFFPWIDAGLDPVLFAFWIVSHIAYNAIYRRHQSIIPVTIIHSTNNIMTYMGLGQVSFAIFIAVAAWVMYIRRRAKKALPHDV